jgi:DnaJ-class molecular chaperone
MKNIKQKRCKNCNGSGYVPMYFIGQLGKWLKKCPICNGTGKIKTEIKEND